MLLIAQAREFQILFLPNVSTTLRGPLQWHGPKPEATVNLYVSNSGMRKFQSNQGKDTIIRAVKATMKAITIHMKS